LSNPWEACTEMWLVADRIKRALPTLDLSDELRGEIVALCDDWGDMPHRFAGIAVDRVFADRCIQVSLMKARALEQALEVASKKDARHRYASLLMSAASAKVIDAYGGWTPPPALPPKLSHKEWSERLVSSMILKLSRNVLIQRLSDGKRAGWLHPLATRIPGPPLTEDERAQVKAVARLIVAMHPPPPATPVSRDSLAARAKD
jgi:hypothetical protein